MRKWLDDHPGKLDAYDDALTRKIGEKIMVVDVNTLRVKIRDMDIEYGY